MTDVPDREVPAAKFGHPQSGSQHEAGQAACEEEACSERATSSQLPAKRSTTAISAISKIIIASPAKPEAGTPTSCPVKMVAAASSMLPPTMIASARPEMV